MSALDIKNCLEELEIIVGAWTGKIYEIGGVFLFKFKPSGESRTDLIIEPGKRIHLTEMKYETPTHPPSYPMLLRKYLENSKLTDIIQPDMERIVNLKFESKKGTFYLIAELFGDGNLILCDKDRKIIQPYRTKSWKHREIKSGQEYSLPPKKGKNISSISINELEEVLKESKELVRGLARNLNIGGDLSEEICSRAGISKETDPNELSKSDYEKIHEVIKDILTRKKSPVIVYENEEPIQVLPFPFETQQDQESESFESFNEALDKYFQKIAREKVEDKKESILEKKLNKIKSKLEKQENQIQEMKEKKKETKRKADKISTCNKTVDEILEKLDKIRNEKGWENIDEIIQEASKEGKKWASMIESVDPHKGEVTINFPEVSVKIDIRLSSFENAAKFYKEYKRSKSKIEGAKKAREKTLREIEELKEEEIEIPEKPAPKKTRKRMWYEKYRWCYSSDGFLIIAGRDKKTNQEVVEKHMESQDLYLHADLEGAPHTVIKSENKKIPESTIGEAAKLAAAYSRAWKKGLANADVYWAKPEQVTKETPAGEYLPQGSYMIKGERNYLTVPVEVEIGLFKEDNGNDVLMCGPISAISARSEILAKLKPGPTKKSELAKELKEEIEEKTGKKVDIDELMRILPPGPGMIITE